MENSYSTAAHTKATGDGQTDSASQSAYDLQSVLNQSKQSAAINAYGGDKGKEEVNLWQSILKDVAERDEMKDSHLIVLGENGAGKRSLIRALNKNFIKATNKLQSVDNMGSNYSALDSFFLYIKDLNDKDQLGSVVTSDDNLPKFNVWMMEETHKQELLHEIIQPDNLGNTAALIMLDFDQPWDMKISLQKWMTVLQDAMFKLLPKLPLKEQDKLKNKLSNYIKTFEDPELDEDGKIVRKAAAQENQNDDEDDIANLKTQMDLPEGVLTVNLGIPIIVVCSKIDLLLHGDKADLLEGNLDFIQKHIRQYSIQYGASVIFTSQNTLTNVETLYKYLLHRIYGVEFPHKSELNKKDSLFIPTGFDSINLINELCKNMDDAVLFEEVLKKPAEKQNKTQKTADVQCDDWYTIMQNEFNRKKSGMDPTSMKKGDGSQRPNPAGGSLSAALRSKPSSSATQGARDAASKGGEQPKAREFYKQLLGSKVVQDYKKRQSVLPSAADASALQDQLKETAAKNDEEQKQEKQQPPAAAASEDKAEISSPQKEPTQTADEVKADE